MKERIEHDMLGSLPVPGDRYCGIHTCRAEGNFRLSGRSVAPELIRAFATVKKACAAANEELGLLDPEKSAAIRSACAEIETGKFGGEFLTDALQGGAGTSTNMSLNEVIANRALELLGRAKGDYAFLHPLDHVNLHQSTNDVYPTALKVAVIAALRRLSAKLAELQDVFQRKENEFSDVVKTGRTELQDAVPMTLGAEFSAFAEAFARDRWRTFKCEERIRTVNLGGTAIGTGITAPRRYIFLVIEKLREFTGYGLSRGENCIDQTANADCFVEVSGMLNACAANFLKVCRDLRLLHTLGEIRLPVMQAGSSIMPGKVNPVITEALIQGGMTARSCGHLVEECAAAGTLQINEFMPLLADSLLTELRLLENMCAMLIPHAAGITADRQRCMEYFDRSPQAITALIPHITYDQAAQLLKEFQAQSDIGLRDFLKTRLDPDLVDRLLHPRNLIALGYKD